MIKSLLVDLAALFVYMTAWWLFAKQRKRLDTVDTAWGGGFVLVALLSFVIKHNWRTGLIGLLVLIWGMRLAWHIWRRAGKKGPDPRYETLSSKWDKKTFWLRAYVSIFLLQGITILIVALPIAVAGGETKKISSLLAIIGLIIWSIGFVIEALGDRQLSIFVNDSKNKGKVLDTGLWHYSRHPNYFGELTQWWAIAILALGQLSGLIGLIGPALLTFLIVFVSGIPSIENRRKDNDDYQEYKRRTSVLIPLPAKSK